MKRETDRLTHRQNKGTIKSCTDSPDDDDDDYDYGDDGAIELMRRVQASTKAVL